MIISNKQREFEAKADRLMALVRIENIRNDGKGSQRSRYIMRRWHDAQSEIFREHLSHDENWESTN